VDEAHAALTSIAETAQRALTYVSVDPATIHLALNYELLFTVHDWADRSPWSGELRAALQRVESAIVSATDQLVGLGAFHVLYRQAVAEIHAAHKRTQVLRQELGECSENGSDARCMIYEVAAMRQHGQSMPRDLLRLISLMPGGAKFLPNSFSSSIHGSFSIRRLVRRILGKYYEARPEHCLFLGDTATARLFSRRRNPQLCMQAACPRSRRPRRVTRPVHRLLRRLNTFLPALVCWCSGSSPSPSTTASAVACCLSTYAPGGTQWRWTTERSCCSSPSAWHGLGVRRQGVCRRKRAAYVRDATR
jgi:hypothetical protein